MKIIVGITGASGAIYGRLLTEVIVNSARVSEIALVISRNGRAVMEYEKESILTDHPKIVVYSNDDLFAAPASGSACYEAMVIAPCSMGTLARIATGVSQDLMTRAADVMLKERRKLILIPRETPLSTIHLRNMTVLSECGAVVMPAMPSFYSLPSDKEEICMTVIERITAHLGLDTERYMWG